MNYLGMENQTNAVSKGARWGGWVMSVLPALMMVFSASMKFTSSPELSKGFEHLGIPEKLATGLGILELSCTALYLFPRTAVLGAILLTGYLGGAILTHLRVGDAYFVQFLLGVVFWGGLYLRDPRIRDLIPFRK